MADNTNKSGVVDAGREDTISALPDNGSDPSRSPGGAVVAAKADPDAPPSYEDRMAYRERGGNGRKRAEFMERLIIDQFFNGDVRRYDEAAGLDFDAK